MAKVIAISARLSFTRQLEEKKDDFLLSKFMVEPKNLEEKNSKISAIEMCTFSSWAIELDF